MHLKIRITCGACDMTLLAVHSHIRSTTVSDRELAQYLETITHRCDGEADLISPKMVANKKEMD